MSDFNSTVEVQEVPAGATVDAVQAPDQAADEVATALSDILAVSQPADGQQENSQTEAGQDDPSESDKGHEPLTERQQRAVLGRTKDAERRAEKRGYERAFAELESRFTEQLNQTIAPFREAMLDQQAKSIAADLKVPPEIARELAEHRAGLQKPANAPAPEKPATQAETTRDDKGRFVRQEQNAKPDVAAFGAQLRVQAQEIQAEYGVDMVNAFQNNPTIRSKVTGGEWDFWRALAYLDKNPSTEKKGSIPSPVRTPNHSQAAKSVKDMTEAEFEEVQKRVRNGEKIDLRR